MVKHLASICETKNLQNFGRESYWYVDVLTD
jgi:uncharacterized protein Veg